MAKRQYTDAQRQEALDLYETDGPTAVLRQLGIPKETVTTWAKRAGIRTVRNEKTAAATEARITDLKAVRALAASEALDVFQQATSIVRERLTSAPDEINARDIGTLAGIFADKHLALTKYDDTGHEAASAVDKWLDHMMGDQGGGSTTDG